MSAILYGLATCPYCRAEKKYLTKHSVDFEYVEVDKLDEDEKDRVVQHVRDNTGGTLFPILEVHDKFIIGFDKKKIIAEFDLDV